MVLSKINSEFAVVILSCDKYADLWEGFFYLLNKSIEIPFKKYLISNHLRYADTKTSNLEVICNGDDQDWSSNFLSALKKISEKKIFVILEDIFITSKIEKHDFDELVRFTIDKDIQHIKYLGDPPAQIPFDKLLSKYESGMPYLVSVCGIWDREYLQSIILPGENPWEFEVNASYRAKFSAKEFYGCNNPLFEYRNMVEKGGWIPASIDWAIENKVPINTNGRIRNQYYLYYLKRMIFKISMCIPWRIRVWLISLLKKLIIAY